jgi:hypothetical protein
LLTHLHYPQDVAGAPNAAAIGLDTGHVLLLPSFLRCLTHLKAQRCHSRLKGSRRTVLQESPTRGSNFLQHGDA